MTELTEQQVKEIREDCATHPESAFVRCLENQDVIALCDLALLALRQQDGMVMVPRETAEKAARILGQVDNFSAIATSVALNGLLAASGQDQPKAAAGQEQEGKVLGTSRATQPASAAALLDAVERKLDLLRGIRLGIEAAAKVCDARFDQADALCTREAQFCARAIRSLNPSDIAASEKNPGAGQHTTTASQAETPSPAQPLGADWQAAKLRVVEKWPQANAFMFEGLWYVASHTETLPYKLGSGPTEAEAWLDADRRM